MASSIKVDHVSNHCISMVVGTVEGEMIDCFRCPDLGIFDQIDELSVRREVGAGELDDPRGDGGREKEILSLRGCVFVNELEDFFNVLLEPLL